MRKCFSRIEGSFKWLVGADLEKALMLMSVLVRYGHSEMPKEPEFDRPDLVRTLIKANGLWSGLFTVMTKTVEDDKKGESSALNVYVTTTRALSSCLAHYVVRFPNEGAIFVRFLVRAGIFDALDVSLPYFASRADVSGA